MTTPKKNDGLPDLGDLRKLTETHVARIIAADYLKALAKMIEEGKAVGFDLAWDERFQKPVGKVMASANIFQGPLEVKLVAQVAEEKNAIQVQDLTQDLQDAAEDHPEITEILDDTSNLS